MIAAALAYFGPKLSSLWLKVAAILGLLLGLLMAALYILNIGKKLEQGAEAKAEVDAVSKKQEIDNEVSSLGHADLDKRFDRWVQPDPPADK